MLTALDVYYLVKEMQSLENSKIDAIFHLNDTPKIVCLQLHITSKGKHFLKCQVPDFMCISGSKDTGTMTGFGMMLRKYLEGARIKFIQQKDFERVITILFERQGEEYRLIFELFSKGNIIFCDKEKILGILEEQEWRDRKLKRSQPYEYPKSNNNILATEFREFLDKIKSSNKESIVKSLAMDFGFGGIYAEWLCKQSGVEKDKKISEIEIGEIEKMHKSIKSAFGMKIDANVLEGKAHPFMLTEDAKRFASFSDAISSLNIDKASQLKNKALEKLRLIIQEQELALAECEKQHLENQAKAEYIYHQYQKIDMLLKKVQELRKKHPWREIKSMMPEIKDIDEKNHKIRVDI